MGDIFVSYASDDKNRMPLLIDALAAQGWSVWWDRTIPPGKTFDEVIEEALEAAKCVIVVWSQTSVKSQWVKTEAAEALKRRILVPILLDDVTIPLEFRRIQAARLINWKGATDEPEWRKLAKSVSALVGQPLAQPVAQTATGVEPAADQRPETIPDREQQIQEDVRRPRKKPLVFFSVILGIAIVPLAAYGGLLVFVGLEESNDDPLLVGLLLLLAALVLLIWLIKRIHAAARCRRIHSEAPRVRKKPLLMANVVLGIAIGLLVVYLVARENRSSFRLTKEIEAGAFFLLLLSIWLFVVALWQVFGRKSSLIAVTAQVILGAVIGFLSGIGFGSLM
jgi:hypothetical protein